MPSAARKSSAYSTPQNSSLFFLSEVGFLRFGQQNSIAARTLDNLVLPTYLKISLHPKYSVSTINCPMDQDYTLLEESKESA
jgi:hypothetical protein